MNAISIIDQGMQWAAARKPPDLPESLYCASRDVFSVRLERLLAELEKMIGEDAYLISAVVGEIGNNSFDHNLGNWPDVPGVYFAHDPAAKTIVVADRGQGVKTTIGRVVPEVKDDQEALLVAFTQVLSGRSGEKRGNGLKFVDSAVMENRWVLRFQSGAAMIVRAPNMPFAPTQAKLKIPGVFAILSY